MDEEVVEAAPVEGLHPAVGDAGALVQQHLASLQCHLFWSTVVICKINHIQDASSIHRPRLT